MTFHDWLFSNYPENSAIQGQWGPLHIVTLAACIVLIVVLSCLFAKKSERTRQRVILVLAICILVFEVARRVINFSRGETLTFTFFLYLILPRPWCAISCWFMIVAAFAKKRFLYNFCAMNALLCALVFFAYPSVGFNHRHILFENVYSIATHSLLLISSVVLMTLNLTSFQLRKGNLLKEGGLLVGMYAYTFIETFWLKIEPNPMQLLPNNDVQKVLGLPYPPYLVVYFVFLAVYFSAFYVVQHILDKHRHKTPFSTLQAQKEEAYR